PRTSDPGLLRRSGPPRTILDRAAGSDGIAAPSQGRLSRLRGRPGRLTATGRAKAGPCRGGARLGRAGDGPGLGRAAAGEGLAVRRRGKAGPCCGGARLGRAAAGQGWAVLRRGKAWPCCGGQSWAVLGAKMDWGTTGRRYGADRGPSGHFSLAGRRPPQGAPAPRRARAPGPAQAPRPGPGSAGQMSGLPCCRASLRSRKNPRVMAIRTPRTVTGHIRTYPVSNQVMMFSFPEMTKWELSWRAATAGSARDGGGGFLGLLFEVPGDLPDP